MPETPAAPPTPAPGTFGWFDATFQSGNVSRVRAFYESVCRWRADPVPMADDDGRYDDYVMMAPGNVPVGGVCHRRGSNADVPEGWIPYAVVEDMAAALKAVRAAGGSVTHEPREAGGGQIAYIRDPAGVTLGLYEG